MSRPALVRPMGSIPLKPAKRNPRPSRRALDELDASIQDAAEFAGTLPSDPDAEVDADAVAEHQTAIQDAASAVGDACTDD